MLRPFRDTDLATVIDIQSAPRTHPHENRPASPSEARALFEAWRRHWSEHGFGYVAVVEVDSGVVVGIGGVQRRELDGETVLNLYYRFAPDAWGKGYATEMGTAIVEWAAQEVPLWPVVIVTNVSNKPARRVADKLGFREYKRGRYQGVRAVYYRRDADGAATGGP